LLAEIPNRSWHRPIDGQGRWEAMSLVLGLTKVEPREQSMTWISHRHMNLSTQRARGVHSTGIAKNYFVLRYVPTYFILIIIICKNVLACAANH